MLGVAISCIGLSYDDFCRLTREEFQHIYDAYQERQESEYHIEWERMRMLAAIVIQPHCKKKITPQKLLPFPWESKKKADRPIPTAAEDKARLESLLKRIKK